MEPSILFQLVVVNCGSELVWIVNLICQARWFIFILMYLLTDQVPVTNINRRAQWVHLSMPQCDNNETRKIGVNKIIPRTRESSIK